MVTGVRSQEGPNEGAGGPSDRLAHDGMPHPPVCVVTTDVVSIFSCRAVKPPGLVAFVEARLAEGGLYISEATVRDRENGIAMARGGERVELAIALEETWTRFLARLPSDRIIRSDAASDRDFKRLQADDRVMRLFETLAHSRCRQFVSDLRIAGDAGRTGLPVATCSVLRFRGLQAPAGIPLIVDLRDIPHDG